MSNRPGPLTAAQQLDVGAQVIALRADGWCWKRLEDWFRMSRSQLWRCQRRAERAAEKRRMQQKTGGMQHQVHCAIG